VGKYPVGTLTPAAEHPIIYRGDMVRAIREDRKTQTRRLRGLRKINARPDEWMLVEVRSDGSSAVFAWKGSTAGNVDVAEIRCPWHIGDHLWVREACRAEELETGQDGVRYLADDQFIPIPNSKAIADVWGDLYWYRAKKREDGLGKVVPSIHMPRWASRIDLEVTGFWYERVQDIHKLEAVEEGVEYRDGYWLGGIHPVKGSLQRWSTARQAFAKLRDSIHETPRPIKKRRVITHYVSHPWESIQEDRTYRGKPWYVRGNPWVLATTFRRIEGGA